MAAVRVLYLQYVHLSFICTCLACWHYQ